MRAQAHGGRPAGWRIGEARAAILASATASGSREPPTGRTTASAGAGGGAARRAATRAAVAAAAMILLAGVAATSCSTVDPGDPPADVNVCHPSQTFFAAMVWPGFLSKVYPDGKTCGDSACHGNSARRLHVVAPTSTPTPAIPFVAGSDWDQLYNSTTQVMLCTDVLGSELFTRPAGLQTHAVTLIDPSPSGPEAMLLESWVKAPP